MNKIEVFQIGKTPAVLDKDITAIEVSDTDYAKIKTMEKLTDAINNLGRKI